MPNNITKIIFRQGLEEQRRAGIPFNSAEPAYAFDTKRLYIGDSQHLGGIPVGVRNLGSINKLFGTYQNTGFTQEAVNIFTLSGCEVNDIIYDRDTRILYSLTARSGNIPLSGDLVKYDFTVLIDPVFFSFSPALGNQLTINDESIGIRQIPSSICAPGGGLFKTDKNSGIAISTNGITNAMMVRAPKYTVKGNPYSGTGDVIDIECAPSQFIGRSSTSVLTALPFSTLLADASIIGTNGISVATVGTTTYLQLSTSHFYIQSIPNIINLRAPTTINNTLSVVNGYTSSGPLQCGSATTTTLNTQGNTVNCGTINCGNIFMTPNTITCGPVVCTTINTQGNTITTSNGNITMGNGDLSCDQINSGAISCTTLTTNSNTINCGAISCTTINTNGNNIDSGNGNITSTSIIQGATLRSTGDVIAYYSDRRLKENIKPIDGALDKVCKLRGFTYTPNALAKELGFNATIKNVGLFAQDVEEVLPEAVRLAPFDASDSGESISGESYKTIQYEKLVPLLVEGIKELQNEIIELKNEIQLLRQ